MLLVRERLGLAGDALEGRGRDVGARRVWIGRKEPVPVGRKRK